MPKTRKKKTKIITPKNKKKVKKKRKKNRSTTQMRSTGSRSTPMLGATNGGGSTPPLWGRPSSMGGRSTLDRPQASMVIHYLVPKVDVDLIRESEGERSTRVIKKTLKLKYFEIIYSLIFTID